ncbi:Glycosyltransferase family 87 [Acidimicrobiia bacterium]
MGAPTESSVTSSGGENPRNVVVDAGSRPVRRFIPSLSPGQWIALGIPVLCATFLALYQLVAPNALVGVQSLSGAGYDDGVHVGTALRLTQLALPYRDYVFLHPPGIAVLLTPIALIGRVTSEQWALVLARLLTAIVVVANVALVGYLLRKRGAGAMLIAGLILALWPLAPHATHSVMIEPFAGFFILLAMVSMFRGDTIAGSRRLVVAGACLGIALSLKLVAVLPIAALCAVCLLRVRSQLSRLLLGMAISLSIVMVPFVVLSPGNFIREVIVTQSQRKPVLPSGQSIPVRLATIFGFESYPSSRSAGTFAMWFAVLLIVVVTLTFVVRRKRTTPFDVAVLLGSIFTVGFELRTPEVFSHYPYPSTIFLAMLLGVCAGEFARVLGRLIKRSGGAAWQPVISIVGSTLIVLVAVFVAMPRSISESNGLLEKSIDPSSWIRSVIPAGSCVVFDVPTLAVVGDRLLADSSCPDLIDPFGLWLDEGDHFSANQAKSKPPELVDTWEGYLREADFVIMSVDYSNFIPWTPALRAEFAENFVKVPSDSPVVIYRKV